MDMLVYIGIPILIYMIVAVIVTAVTARFVLKNDKDLAPLIGIFWPILPIVLVFVGFARLLFWVAEEL